MFRALTGLTGKSYSYTAQHTLSSCIRTACSRLMTSCIPDSVDKEQYSSSINLIALKIPAKQCNALKTRRIYDVPDDPDHRLVLLSEEISDLELSTLPEELKKFNEAQGGTSTRFTLKVGYDELAVDEVLAKLLPTNITERPSSFEQAGHLAHLNLREEVLPYKHLIGQVILDKNPRLKTVVNKIGNIESEFRTFPMEVIAGEEDFNVTVKECGSTFTFNFKDVYWNSRLSTEHQRLIDAIIANVTSTEVKSAKQTTVGSPASPATKKARVSSLSVVADMMGGVGPFAVPLGKSQTCEVHCNDLNPESYKYMLVNAKKNKCLPCYLSCYNLDGREFIKHMASINKRVDHAIMNLPQNATDFLDVFIGYSRRYGDDGTQRDVSHLLPVVHVYAFSTCIENSSTAVADVAERCAGILRCTVEELGTQRLVQPEGSKLRDTTSADRSYYDSCWGHVVRDVSPHKRMICLSFRIPTSVALAEPVV